MNRHSPEYEERRLLWELTQSPAWQQVLRPQLLRHADNINRSPIRTMDGAMVHASSIAKASFAKNLILEVERKARDFVNNDNIYPDKMPPALETTPWWKKILKSAIKK